MSFEAFKLKGGFIDGSEVLNFVRKFIGQVLWQGSRTGLAFFLEQQAPGTRGPSGFAVLRGFGCNKWRAVRRLCALAGSPLGALDTPAGQVSGMIRREDKAGHRAGIRALAASHDAYGAGPPGRDRTRAAAKRGVGAGRPRKSQPQSGLGSGRARWSRGG